MNPQIVNNDLKKVFEERVQLSKEKKNEAINYWKPIVDAIVDYFSRAMIDFLLYLELVQVVIMKKHK